MTIPQPTSSPRERMLFLGSGLVLLAAILLGLAREQHWGQRFVRLTLLTRNAAGIRPGQEVRISGMPVGRVGRLQLQPNADVSIEVQVAQRYAALIGPMSVARQGQEGFVGDHYLEISADPQPAGQSSPTRGRQLRYEQAMELRPLLEQLQASLINTNKLTGNDLPHTLREARRSLGEVNNLADTLQRESAATGPDLRETLRQLSRTGSNAEQTSTQARELLQASQPALLRTLEDVQKLTRTSQRLLQGLMGLTGMDEDTNRPPQQP
jgi:ABC-type transporter Mla subunit MlaD